MEQSFELLRMQVSGPSIKPTSTKLYLALHHLHFGNECGDWKCVRVFFGLIRQEHSESMPRQSFVQYGPGVYGWCGSGVFD